MTDQDTTPTPDYLKGFNEGYLLTKHVPELAAKLSAAVPESERGNGFKEGRTQFIQEKQKDKYPEWLINKRSAKGKNDKEDRDLDKE